YSLDVTQRLLFIFVLKWRVGTCIYLRIFTGDLQEGSKERMGVVDIGSDTIGLGIIEFDTKTGLNESLTIKSEERLSQYICDDLKMNQDGIDVLTTTLHSFKSIANKFEVNELHPVATAAIRQTTNQNEMIKHIKSELDISIKIIPYQEEAFYGF